MAKQRIEPEKGPIVKKILIFNDDLQPIEQAISDEIIAEARKLPYDHAAYFKNYNDAELIETDSLVLSRARPKGIRNAVGLMLKASNGEMERRDPIQVVALPGGRFRVLDGNSTATIAIAAGWADVPCLISTDQGV